MRQRKLVPEAGQPDQSEDDGHEPGDPDSRSQAMHQDRFQMLVSGRPVDEADRNDQWNGVPYLLERNRGGDHECQIFIHGDVRI